MSTDTERREAAWLPEGTDPMPGIPEVRVLDEGGREMFRGYYYRHVNRQVEPIRDSLRSEDVDHCVVHDDFADWNMPKSFRATKITPPHRIEVVGDIDRREVTTCTVESSHECDSELEWLSLWKYKLSCEHTVYYNCQLPPSYCPECGKKVQFDAYDYI